MNAARLRMYHKIQDLDLRSLVKLGRRVKSILESNVWIKHDTRIRLEDCLDMIRSQIDC